MAYQRQIPPISPAQAEAEPPEARVFAMPEATIPDMRPRPTPRQYAERVYTVHAISPTGFPVDLAFADVKLGDLEQHITRLSEMGYTPPSAGVVAAPAVDDSDLPPGWKLCRKHGAPMRPRNKQGQDWHSHNVGTRDAPVYCKGYRGTDSPGYEID